MNASQKTYLKALDSTLVCLGQNHTMVALLPNTTPTIADVTNKVSNLYALDTQLQGLNMLNSESKTKRRAALIEFLAIGRAYAIHQNKDNLA